MFGAQFCNLASLILKERIEGHHQRIGFLPDHSGECGVNLPWSPRVHAQNRQAEFLSRRLDALQTIGKKGDRNRRIHQESHT